MTRDEKEQSTTEDPVTREIDEPIESGDEEEIDVVDEEEAEETAQIKAELAEREREKESQP